MINMLETIKPKSDQLNADDLLGGPMTVRITNVAGCPDPNQPVAISFDGDGDRAYKPCKSMRRVLVRVWGIKAETYIGRSMTLYRDDKVQFGGFETGGIRISHMSDITKPVTIPLTASRTNRKPFIVNPLVVTTDSALAEAPDAARLAQEATEQAALGAEAYKAFWSGLTKAERACLLPQHEALKASATAADEAKVEAPTETPAPATDDATTTEKEAA